MADVFKVLPELSGDELMYVQGLLKDATEEQAAQFAMGYRIRRKDPTTVLILTLVGFLGFGGINRFYVDQVGMGILYILTGGLCLIGTIIDIVTYKSIAFSFNQRAAHEIKIAMGF